MPSQLAFILHSPFQNVIIRQLWRSVFLACSFTLFFTTDFPIHIFSHIHCTALLTSSSSSFSFLFYLLLVLQYLSKKNFIPSVTTFSIIDVKLQKCKPLIICCLYFRACSLFYLVSLFCALCHRYVWHASSFICPAYCWWLCIGWFNLGLWPKWLRAGVDFRFKYYQ